MTAEWVLLARLARPQGRKGEIIADLLTDFPDRFTAQPRVFLMGASGGAREMLIERYWLHQGRVVLKFQGVDSINDAETLRRLDVVVPRDERVPLTDDAVYIGDLVGCLVIDTADKAEVVVGEIEDVERGQGGALDLLVVKPLTQPLTKPTASVDEAPSEAKPRRGKRAKRSSELLIPFAKKYLVSVDIEAKRVVMRLPAGLVDLNSEVEDA